MIPYHVRHRQYGWPGPGRRADGLMVRAVVLRTFLPGDTRATQNIEEQSAAPGITCDVYVYEPRYTTILRNVPIAPQAGGLNDQTQWKPRETSIDIQTGTLRFNTNDTGPATKAHHMDGDHVIVQFLGGDLNQPIITGQLFHPSSKRKPNVNDGVKYKTRSFVRGIDWGVTDDGNVQINVTGASDGSTLPNGTEIPTGTPAAGNITLTMLPGVLGSAQKVSIQASTGSSPEAVMVGETYLSDQQTLLTQQNSRNIALDALLAEISAKLGSLTGTPPTTLVPYQTASVLLTQQIASLLPKIATSQTVGPPYLSVYLETD